jgi:hypothetical protein
LVQNFSDCEGGGDPSINSINLLLGLMTNIECGQVLPTVVFHLLQDKIMIGPKSKELNFKDYVFF